MGYLFLKKAVAEVSNKLMKDSDRNSRKASQKKNRCTGQDSPSSCRYYKENNENLDYARA